jgi:ABC-type amino acid transport substrate-binding protein
MLRAWLAVLMTSALLAAAPLRPADAQTLERIQQEGEIRLGVRTDAPPFAYRMDDGSYAGFVVDLCREVVAHLEAALDLETLEVTYVEVGAQDRFTAIRDGRIDLLCGPTSHTYERRRFVDFSIPTFNDGASVLLRDDGPQSFDKLAGEKIGVRAGTTTQVALEDTLERLGIEAEIVALDSHYQGVQRLSDGRLSAYFGDWGILLNLLIQAEHPQRLRLSDKHFGTELYALALPRGHTDFRAAVDEGLARTYGSDRVDALFKKHFQGVAPTELLRAIYVLFAVRG